MINVVLDYIQNALYLAMDLKVIAGFIVGYFIRPHIVFRR
jgi:hypothetical protein